MSTRPLIALDTSVVVPLLVTSHPAYLQVTNWARGRSLAVVGHALIETYSVLTRLPGDARLLPEDAVQVISDSFIHLPLPLEWSREPHRLLAAKRVAGGATYDGLVALAALANNAVLATRDARARPTYEAVGVQIEIVA